MPQDDHKSERSFSTGYRLLKDVPKYDYSQAFDDPEIRERIGALIARAVEHKN